MLLGDEIFIAYNVLRKYVLYFKISSISPLENNGQFFFPINGKYLSCG